MIKDYYVLAKGGLVIGNLIPVVGGFALALEVQGLAFSAQVFIASLAGLALVMASGGVFNNYIDRDIDKLMKRTSERALLRGKVSAKSALTFGTILFVLGIATLAIFTNFLTVFLALLGFFLYVFIYSLVFKRMSPYGTFIGSLSGAIPPVVGYAAAGDRFDFAAVILLFILITWQIAHFYAIAIRREEDYAAAKIPVMPVRHGVGRTKISLTIFILEFIIAASFLAIFRFAGQIYLATTLVLGFSWFALAVRGFWITKPAAVREWARGVFLFSLVVMVGLFSVLAITGFTVK